MKDFYKQRLQRHQKKMLGFLKYVFNDHVVLMLIFILGGFGFYYSSFVNTLDASFKIGLPIVLVIWFLSLQVGKIATLLEPADELFLLAKETQMVAYFKESLKHALVLPFVFLTIVNTLTFPLLQAVSGISGGEFLLFNLFLWLLKMADLVQQMQKMLLSNEKSRQQTRLINLIVQVLALSIGLYVSVYLGLVLSIISLLYQRHMLKKTWEQNQLSWSVMIADEKERLHKIYRFINMFTDVPGMVSPIRRRKYLDPLLKIIPKESKNTYLYLFARRFLRGAEYSGLYVRLLVIGGLLLFFLDEFWLLLFLGLVIIYLIGFQLLPLATEFDYMIMTRLYPINADQKQVALKKIMTVLLVLVSFVFSLMILFAGVTWQQILLLIGAFFLETFLFVVFYLPQRLKKISKY